MNEIKLPKMPKPWYLDKLPAYTEGQIQEYAEEAVRMNQTPEISLLKSKAYAFDEWIKKTNWVQERIHTFPVSALGKHRADTMREEIERLRAVHDRPVQKIDQVAIQYAHRMAMYLECILCEYSGKFYDEAIDALSNYRTDMNEIHEKDSPTHMGEPTEITRGTVAPVDERRAFEEFLSDFDGSNNFDIGDFPHYKDWDVQRAWIGWQAGRAALTSVSNQAQQDAPLPTTAAQETGPKDALRIAVDEREDFEGLDADYGPSVLIPQGLLMAACYAFDKKRDAQRVMELFRKYIKRNWNARTTLAPAPNDKDAARYQYILDNLRENISVIVDEDVPATAEELNDLIDEGIAKEGKE